MRSVHRWLSTPKGVIALGLLMLAVTWLLLGAGAGWRYAAILAGIAVVDVVLGMAGRTLSAEINRAYHHNRWRYWIWAIIMAALIVLGLNAHFTGV